MIPTCHESWRHCILVACRIPLEHALITQSLRELEDRGINPTEQLLQSYGEGHVHQMHAWFRRAADERDAC